MRVLLPRLEGTGSVKQAEGFAARVQDRRRHAAQMAVAGKIVLAAVNGDWSVAHRSQPQSIGAAQIFVPQASGYDGAAGSAVGKVLIADRVQHDPVGIAECNHEIGAGDLRMKELHFRERQPSQGSILLPPLSDLRERHDAVARRGARIKTKIAASLPTVGHNRRQAADRQTTTTLKRVASALDA